MNVLSQAPPSTFSRFGIKWRWNQEDIVVSCDLLIIKDGWTPLFKDLSLYCFVS